MKSHSGLIEKISWLFALGVDASTIEVFGVRDITIRTWLWYSGTRKESELASRWQIPVERVQYLITDCGLDPFKSARWVEENQALFLREKQKAFEDSLFPRHFRPEPAETPA